MIPALEAREVSRTYGHFQALSPTDLTLNPGEIVTLTGPNGSGKTTLLLCLSGLLAPTSGSILVEGHDLIREEQAARERLAYVPDVPRFYSELTAWEHLRFLAMAHNMESGFETRAETLLREFGLWEARDLYPQNYSRGMRLKLGVLTALIRPLCVLLLDEPTSALDTESVELLIEQMKRLRSEGAAILFSTHSPELVHGLANRSLSMHNGQVETA